jgi:hypothetical protein
VAPPETVERNQGKVERSPEKVERILPEGEAGLPPPQRSSGGGGLWRAGHGADLCRRRRSRQEAEIRHIHEKAVMAQEIDTYNRKTYCSQ